MRVGQILILLSLCFSAFAVEVDPITLTTVYKYDKKGRRDRSETSSLVLVPKANGDMNYVQVRVFDGRGREKRGKRKNISARDLRGDGEVIKSQMGVNVISLRSNNVSEPYGGDVIIDYLELWGGLFGSNTRNQVEIQLERPEGNNWRVVHNGTPFDQMRIYERRDGSKGIERIRFGQSRAMREAQNPPQQAAPAVAPEAAPAASDI